MIFHQTIHLSSRQFRTAIHDLNICGIAEQTVALPGGQLLDDAELFQVGEGLVDGCRGETCLFCQRAGCGDRVFQQSPVNVQCGRCRPAKPADSVAVKVREGDELPGRVHRLAGGDDDGLGEEVEQASQLPVSRTLLSNSE